MQADAEFRSPRGRAESMEICAPSSVQPSATGQSSVCVPSQAARILAGGNPQGGSSNFSPIISPAAVAGVGGATQDVAWGSGGKEMAQTHWKFLSFVALISTIIGGLVGAAVAEIASRPARARDHVPEMYDASTSGIEGYLIDLDGTMYTPGGLVPGAIQFLTFLRDNKKPYVFLSNTGSKTSQGVQDKFSLEYKIPRDMIPLDNIWTAAESQMDMMTDSHQGIPENAYLFILSGFRGGDGYNSKQWLDDMRARNNTLVKTWTVRTAISIEEAQKWGAIGSKGEIKVYVVLFLDGQLSPTDPMSPNVESADYEADWSFALMAKMSAILVKGKGSLIYPANDPFNPSKGFVDPSRPDSDPHFFPTPGPGMLAALFKTLMYPCEDDSRVVCAGKGGNLGKKFMMEKAIELLKKQGHTGDKSKIAMIGDRFDTDIRGGVSVGIKTIHVNSGIHSHNVQSFYSDAPATWFVSTVRDLVPGAWPKRSRRFSYHGLSDSGGSWPDWFQRARSPTAVV